MESAMNLLIDIGNSYIKWAICEGSTIIETGSQPITLDFSILSQYIDKIEQAFVANVAGDRMADNIQAWAKESGLLYLHFIYTEKSYNGLVNGYNKAEQLGVDRWLGMIGARKRSSNDFILIDIGTAVTVDYVTSDGQHQGGYIVPGVELMSHSLDQQTDVGNQNNIDWSQISTQRGKDTKQAIAGGIMLLVVNFIELIIRKNEVADIFVTGGNAPVLLPCCKNNYQHVPHLVLEGMIEYSLAD